MRALALLASGLLLAGCAANIASKGGRAGGIGTAHGSPEREAAVAQPTPAPSIVEAVRALVGDWRGVRALVSDVPADVSPIPRETAAIPPVAPAPVSREMSPPSDVAERGPMAWLNPRGVAFHMDRNCRYVEPDAVPVVLGLARQSRRPCRTCGGKVTQ